MNITRKSLLSGAVRTRDINITPEQLAAVTEPTRTALIQDIVPHLSRSDREFLLTGIVDYEWDALGNADEENADEEED